MADTLSEKTALLPKNDNTRATGSITAPPQESDSAPQTPEIGEIESIPEEVFSPKCYTIFGRALATAMLSMIVIACVVDATQDVNESTEKLLFSSPFLVLAGGSLLLSAAECLAKPLLKCREKRNHHARSARTDDTSEEQQLLLSQTEAKATTPHHTAISINSEPSATLPPRSGWAKCFNMLQNLNPCHLLGKRNTNFDTDNMGLSQWPTDSYGAQETQLS